jgi:hypothetical protein
MFTAPGENYGRCRRAGAITMPGTMRPPVQPIQRVTALGTFGPPRLQYLPYSIFVNGDTQGYDMAKTLGPYGYIRDQFMPAGQMELGRRRYHLFDPPADEPDSVRVYERRVRGILNNIWGSEIGRCLLNSLFNGIPVWIRPWLGGDDGSCNAITGIESRLSPAIQFLPDTWSPYNCGGPPGNNPEEVLFHELVHASRFTNQGFDNMDHRSLELMTDGEELLAVMITNSFISERGGKQFRRDYNTSTLATQAKTEQFLSSNRNYIERLKAFLAEDDPLVKEVVKLDMPFNVLRDFARLEKAYQNSMGAVIDHAMDQFNPAAKLFHTE